MSISASMGLSEQIRQLLQLLAHMVIPATALIVFSVQLFAKREDAVEQPDGVVLLSHRLPEEHLRHRHVFVSD